MFPIFYWVYIVKKYIVKKYIVNCKNSLIFVVLMEDPIVNYYGRDKTEELFVTSLKNYKYEII